MTETEEESLCWYHKFKSSRCQNIAKWYWPAAESSFVKAMRWCDEHKNDNDILIEGETAQSN